MPVTKGSASRILLGVDGSPSAEVASGLVAGLAWPEGTVVRVITAYPGIVPMDEFPGMGIGMDAATIQESEDAGEAEAQKVADTAAARFAGPAFQAERRVVRGRAATALLDQASDLDASLIVVGSRGRGPIESALLGSVSTEVIGASRRPVLVARRDHIRRILLAVDGSESSAAAAEAIVRWPALHGVPVRVLSVVDLEAGWNPWLLESSKREAHDAVRTALRESHATMAGDAAAHLETAGIPADSGVADGNPAHQLIEAARAWDADLIVLGTHGRSGLGAFLLGSVARSVLSHAPCSVLIVPESGSVEPPRAATRAEIPPQ